MNRRDFLTGALFATQRKTKQLFTPSYKNGYCPICSHKHGPIDSDGLTTLSTGIKGAMVVCGMCLNLFFYIKE